MCRDDTPGTADLLVNPRDALVARRDPLAILKNLGPLPRDDHAYIVTIQSNLSVDAVYSGVAQSARLQFGDLVRLTADLAAAGDQGVVVGVDRFEGQRIPATQRIHALIIDRNQFALGR